jgi:hypothetical protein
MAVAVRDDTLTLMGAGVLAYVGETLTHEAVGHGGMCVALGLHVTRLAPLFMRCSAFSSAVVAAGPAANVVAAGLFLTVLLLARPARPLWSLLLWLNFVFNALVACGYLAVGAATGFGDWPVLFGGITPSIVWRLPAILVAVAAYYGCLRLTAISFRLFSGSGPVAATRLRRRSILPGSAAAIVACAAELAGGRAQILPLLLAVGTTLMVGLSVTLMDNAVLTPGTNDIDHGFIGPSRWLVTASIMLGIGFVLVIGPGLDPTRFT